MSKKTTVAAALNFARIAYQANLVKKSVSPIKCIGKIPGGFSYSSFNAGALIKPETLLTTIESTRAILFQKMSDNDVSYLEYDKLYMDYFIFIKASSMQVNSQLYNKALCKAPLTFDVEVDYIGKTSAQLLTNIYLQDIPEPMITSRVSSVFVCNKTRMPKEFPDWWLAKYKPLIKEGGRPLGKLEFSGGDKSQSTERQIRVSLGDVDPYHHTNWSQYIKFIQEAFGWHQVKTLGNPGYEEFFKRSVKDFSILYQKESSADEVLTVKVSPETASTTNNVFFFDTLNESGGVVTQSRIEYYPSR